MYFEHGVVKGNDGLLQFLEEESACSVTVAGDMSMEGLHRYSFQMRCVIMSLFIFLFAWKMLGDGCCLNGLSWLDAPVGIVTYAGV